MGDERVTQGELPLDPHPWLTNQGHRYPTRERAVNHERQLYLGGGWSPRPEYDQDLTHYRSSGDYR